MPDTLDTFKAVRNDMQILAEQVITFDSEDREIWSELTRLVERMDALLGIAGISAAEADASFTPELQALFKDLYDRQEQLDMVHHMSYWMAFRIISYLQLAWRHPGLDEIHRREIRHYAQQMMPLGSLPPRLERMLATGWDVNSDVRKE